MTVVVSPQEVQQRLVIGSTTWPAAIALAGALAYVGGFVANSKRPSGWAAFVTWIAGWLVGVLIWLVGLMVFASPGD